LGVIFLRIIAPIFTILLLAGCSSGHQPLSQKELDQQFVAAVDKGDTSAVAHLLDAGASIQARNAYGQTALGLAAAKRENAVLDLLLKRGADPAVLDGSGRLTLEEAARDANPLIFEALLAHNSSPKEKKEALFAVASMSVAEVVFPDVSQSPNPVPREHSNWYRAAELLLNNGVPVDARDEENSTPLITSAAYGQRELFELFLQRGADINATDKYGNTALIAAACECAQATMPSTYEIVQTLIERGADINARNGQGRTALMNAVIGFGGIDNAKFLIAKGANLNARDQKGKTALKLAVESDHPDAAQLLRQALLQANSKNSR
jgi:ankyrin repeat protein